MEWPQIAAAFAAGASGCLTMAKLLKTVSARAERTAAPRNTLFVNGEREEITTKVADLIAANVARKADHRALTQTVDEINQARVSDIQVLAEDIRLERRNREREVRDVRGIIEQLAQRVDAGGL